MSTTERGHYCDLPLNDYSGLPKLAPNASWRKRSARYLRKLLMMNPKNIQCSDLFRNESAMRAEQRRHATGSYFYVIHPLSNVSVAIQTVFFFVWFANFILEPIVDCYPGKEAQENNQWMQRKLMTPIRLFLILCLFNLGYVDESMKNIVIESKKIVRRYLTTYFFFDFMTTYIVLEIVVLVNTNLKSLMIIGSVCYALRMLCCFVRVPMLMKFLENFLIQLNLGKKTRYLICITIKTYMYLHLLTFFLHVFAILPIYYRGTITQHSLLIKSGILRRPPNGTFRVYFDLFLLVATYFFGLSQEYTIDELNEQIIVVIISFIGRLYTLYIVADILRLFGIAGVSESLFERYMTVLQEYISNQKLPDALKRRLLMYCKFKYQGRYFKENAIVQTLSESLRTELFLFSARHMMNKNDMFKKLPSTSMSSLVSDMRLETYSPRDTIVQLGWEISDIYFISTGTVAVISIGGFEMCHLEDGDVFGVGCLFFKAQIHSIVAIEDTEVFVISKNQLVDHLRPYPEIMNSFYRSARSWLAGLSRMEEDLSSGKIDILTSLRKGEILEKKTIRLVAQ